jgi:cytochrome c556
MKRYLLTLMAVIVMLADFFVCPLDGQTKKPRERVQASVWMEKKLEFSQNILAALTEANFAEIEGNAENMNFVGYLEKWERGGQPDYKRHVTYFEFANQELIRHAKAKNIDGATLAYNQLTTSCVQCHKIVRDAKK